MTMSNIGHCIQQVDHSLCSLVPYAILAQGEANVILEQSGLFFRQSLLSSDYITRINTLLSKTKGIANTLLDECLKIFPASVVSFQNYFTMHSAVITTIKKNASIEQWVNNLQLLQATANTYQKGITQIATRLTGLIKQMNKVTDEFDSAVRAFNSFIDGDNGELAELDSKLHQLNTNIEGTFAATLTGDLLIAGGVLVILIGSVCSKEEWVSELDKSIEVFVPTDTMELPHLETVYYTNWKLMALGIVTGGVGIGGDVAGLVYLSKLFKEKNKIFFMKSNIEFEIKLSSGINDGCKRLAREMIKLNNNIEEMKKNWLTFNNLLKKTEDDLRNQRISTEMAHLSFESANHSTEESIRNVGMIKNKLSGVITIKDKKGQGIGQMVLKNTHSTLT